MSWRVGLYGLCGAFVFFSLFFLRLLRSPAACRLRTTVLVGHLDRNIVSDTHTSIQVPGSWMPSAGLLDIDTGCAVYEISYESIVFRPFKNEILLAEVSQISSVRVAGALSCAADCSRMEL